MDIIEKTALELENILNNSIIKKANSNTPIPDRKKVISLIKNLQALLFPGYFKTENYGENLLQGKDLLAKVGEELKEIVKTAISFSNSDTVDAEKVYQNFIGQLPQIKALLLKDIQALYNGDPAAKSYEEIIICYPGFYAISIYRLAHALYSLNVPLIPRIMTEFAHEKTGIDIHAGAAIGEYFFIDHGTGIVVGETTVIGNNVKLYQGVTLGAKSFETDQNGNPVKGTKRHPNIGNNVVIYANATILGGQTTIGDNCTIGASVWLTKSIEANQTIYYSN